MNENATTTQIADVARLIETSTQAATAYDRPDLVRRLAGLKEILANPGIHVAVCGEFKQGKSSLVNALTESSLCPVDDDIATAVPTYVGWGDTPRAEVTHGVDAEGVAMRPEPIGIDEIQVAVVEHARREERTAEQVRVWLDHEILRDGLILIDTPGVGGLTSKHGAATLSALPFAEALVFVSDASQEYTEAELEFLRRAIEYCPKVLCVLTKTDIHGEWRRILATNQAHLDRARIDARIVAVSSELKRLADQHSDAQLATESGFDPLLTFLVDEVSSAVNASLVARVHTELLEIIRLIESPFEAELAVLTDPATAADLISDLDRAKERAEQLKSAASRWATTLSDGMGDLTSDVQHDLRRRNRDLLKAAERTIDDNKPAAIWAEFEPWLYARSSEEILANYAIVRDRADELSSTVAAHFAEAGTHAHTSRETFNPDLVLETISADAKVEFDSINVAMKGIGAIRGASSGGFMIRSSVGMVMTSLNPMAAPVLLATAAFGLVMGRKTLSDEGKRELATARGKAKQSVRQYLDEVNFSITKDSQDATRRLQRELRDHYTSIADELHRSTSEALRRAGTAAQHSDAERQTRGKKVEAELKQIGQLRKRIEALTPAIGTHG